MTPDPTFSVSVIIATNRGGPFLEQAIASVNRQTHPVHEVILVDDGSPSPGLKSTAERMGVAYLRQPASGVSAARNAGAELATGTWLAFLDDDDVWDPRKIECQWAALQKDPSAIACFTGGWHIDSDGNDLQAPWYAPAATSREMLSGQVEFPRIVTLLVEKRTFMDVGEFDRDLDQAEDNDLVLRLLLVGEFTAVDEPLVGYRRHTGNVTRRSVVGREISLRMLRDHRKRARRHGDHEAEELIGLNLDRFRRRVAADCVGDVIESLRERDLDFGLRVGWWSMTRVPGPTIAAITGRLRARHTRRLPGGNPVSEPGQDHQ